MGAQRAGPLRGDKYPLAASECTTVSPLGQVLSIELSIDYRIPAAQRPGAAARQSPAGTRVSSPPSALRIARAVVQALTTARAARAPWDRCVAAVSADPGRAAGRPPPGAARPGGPAARRRRGSRERRDRGSGYGDVPRLTHSQSVTPIIYYPYMCTSTSTGIARGERWSVSVYYARAA